MENSSFSYLLPSFGELFSGTPNGMSAIIWILMYAFVMYAGNYVLSRYFKSKKIVAQLEEFHKKLVESKSAASAMLDELREERSQRTLALLLRDMLGNLTENSAFTGATSGEGSIQYISSTQLSYYLNARDLVPDLFDNKFISFVPSLLTGFGVLGTFIGIQLGIGGLDFKVDDIENVTESITMLLAGSTVAFMTSIWGVFFSLLFAVGEKVIIRRIQFDFKEVEYEIGKNIQFVSPENEIVLLRKSNETMVAQMQELISTVKVDYEQVAGMFGREVKAALETQSAINGDNGNREIIQDLGAMIISELRFIKEATEVNQNSSSSFVKIR